MRRVVGMKTLSLFLALLWAPPGNASFHFYDIREIYSNSDGSVQFVELFTTRNGQQSLNGVTVVASQGGDMNTYTFVGSGPSPTINRPLLLATNGFAAACGITPDYILPDNFLFDPDGSVEFGLGVDTAVYTSLPLDGATSLNFPGATTGTNSPENFAGATCSLAATPVPSLGPWGLLALGMIGGAILVRRANMLT